MGRLPLGGVEIPRQRFNDGGEIADPVDRIVRKGLAAKRIDIEPFV